MSTKISLLSTKDPTGTCRQHGYQNQPLGIRMIPYKMQNLVYEWVDFANLRKFWKNQAILLKIWHKIGPIGI